MGDSTVDFLLVAKVNGELTTMAIYNNFDRDNFYLKTRMISDERLATTVTGASVRCVLTSLNDSKYIVASYHTAQTGYHSLQVPYQTVGIGRSNNFIEQFNIAVYSNGRRVLRQWSPIIPKSTLFVISNMVSDETSWEIMLLVNPTSKIPLILIVDVVFLMVLAVIIIILHLREKVSLHPLDFAGRRCTRDSKGKGHVFLLSDQG
jgi:integrin alpha FG-GAP repeat containing protein 1